MSRQKRKREGRPRATHIQATAADVASFIVLESMRAKPKVRFALKKVGGDKTGPLPGEAGDYAVCGQLLPPNRIVANLKNITCAGCKAFCKEYRK